MRFVLAGLLGLLVLASCATMSPKQCAVADWRSLGFQDGNAGAGMLKFSEREEVCAKAGVQADLTAYQAGRQDGLRNFCQPSSGFRAALNGYTYQGACPANLEADFMLGYQDGAAAYAVKQAMSSAQSALDSARNEIDRLDEKVSYFESIARDSSKPQADRDGARDRARELRRDRDEAIRKERDAERELFRRQLDFDRARADIGMRWGAW
jgi:hypothetical protein